MCTFSLSSALIAAIGALGIAGCESDDKGRTTSETSNATSEVTIEEATSAHDPTDVATVSDAPTTEASQAVDSDAPETTVASDTTPANDIAATETEAAQDLAVVAGTITYYGPSSAQPTERLYVGVFAWSETPCNPASLVRAVAVENVSFAAPVPYAIDRVPAGAYAVCAYHDVGGNNPGGSPGPEDPRGFYEGGPTPTYVTVSAVTDTSRVDFTIGDALPDVPPDPGPNAVAGTIAYYGSSVPTATEVLRVGLFHWSGSEPPCQPADLVKGVELYDVSYGFPVAYVIADAPPDYYAVCAYHDFGGNNADGAPGAEDARGFYENGPTPTLIQVGPENDTTFTNFIIE